MHLTSVGCRSDGSQDVAHGSVQSLCSYWGTSSSTKRHFTGSSVICKRKFDFRWLPECAVLSLYILVEKVLQSFQKLGLEITRTRCIGNWTTLRLIFPNAIIQWLLEYWGNMCTQHKKSWHLFIWTEERVKQWMYSSFQPHILIHLLSWCWFYASIMVNGKCNGKSARNHNVDIVWL